MGFKGVSRKIDEASIGSTTSFACVSERAAFRRRLLDFRLAVFLSAAVERGKQTRQVFTQQLDHSAESMCPQSMFDHYFAVQRKYVRLDTRPFAFNQDRASLVN